MQIFKIDQSNPDPAVVAEIAELIKSGLVIAFPTDTFYGLGADIYNEKAVKRVFDIKGRIHGKPILILISDKEELAPLISVKNMPTSAYKLMNEFWPGPLTLVFYSSDVISGILTGTTGKIGVRLPDHTFCIKLIKRLGVPITATSANLSGMPSLDNPSDVLEALGDRIDIMVDGGKTTGRYESTIVDVTGVEPVVLREGAIPASYITRIISGERS